VVEDRQCWWQVRPLLIGKGRVRVFFLRIGQGLNYML